jgi:hypothetical protein
MRLLPFAAACCALGAFAPPQGNNGSALRQLTSSEIETYIVGHGVSLDGASADHGDNFCQVGRWSTGGRIPIYGSYRIEGDRLCITGDLPSSETWCHRYFVDDEHNLYEEAFDSVRQQNVILPINTAPCATE